MVLAALTAASTSLLSTAGVPVEGVVRPIDRYVKPGAAIVAGS